MLDGQSICSSGVLAGTRSNRICSQVTFTRPFAANWPFQVLLSLVFPQPIPIPRICRFPPDQPWIAQHPKCLILQLGPAWISASRTRCWGQTRVFGFCSYNKCSPTAAFKHGVTDGLSHSGLPKNLLYLLCRFPKSHMPKEIPSLGLDLPRG